MIPVSPVNLRDSSWQSAYRNAVTDPLELLALLGLSAADFDISPEAIVQFPLKVPRSFIARMRQGDPTDPLLLQVLPVGAEMNFYDGFSLLDPVGDTQAKSATGVLQKYKGRALLIATGACAIHCRYCFRRYYPYADEPAAANNWRETVDAIGNDPTVDEVILSGGDPLSLSTLKLQALTDALLKIQHVKRLRIHSRLPVTMPERIDDELLAWLASLPWPVTMVVHANHANEFDTPVDNAIANLRREGVTVLNQAVLLKGINDRVTALRDLSERGYDAGILPYYLHVLDRVQGAGHFHVDDERAMALHAELATQLSGYLVPRLVREIPGASGKTPL